MDLSPLQRLAGGFADTIIAISYEFDAILLGVLIFAAIIGAFVFVTALIDITKLGRRNTDVTPSRILWKMLGSSLLIDLSFFVGALSASLWLNHDPLDISQYSASNSDDYSVQAIIAAAGIIAIAGYIAIARGFYNITQLGKSSADGTPMGWVIFWRIVGGSAMVSAVHLAKGASSYVGGDFNIIGYNTLTLINVLT